jgi:2-keto-4-pentenoate hydratase/2-oxohepta-3-ene-1,7-dioic acid hydratase in catechol pathway
MPEVINIKPSKIICVGLNYRDHAEELKMEIPEHPIIFLKPPTTLINNGEAIIYPESQTQELHYEAELAIVINDKIHQIKAEEAARHIFGYTCANDVTARDLQRVDGQWTRAKSFDTFCPVGPRIVSDINPDDLAIKLYLNGELKQSSRTSRMIFKPAHLVSFISRIMTLLPEDIILTGTPPGVGPMQAGDKVEVEIEGIGRLTNYVRKLD